MQLSSPIDFRQLNSPCWTGPQVTRRHPRPWFLGGVAQVLVNLGLGGVVPALGVRHHVAAAARGRALTQRRLYPREDRRAGALYAAGVVVVLAAVDAVADATVIEAPIRVELQIAADVLKERGEHKLCEKRIFFFANERNANIFFCIEQTWHLFKGDKEQWCKYLVAAAAAAACNMAALPRFLPIELFLFLQRES
jgi:hypothetical protein